MAIKAGRVGVAPSQVDMAGNVVGAGSGYTKAEADAKFATKSELSGKVPASQLQANSKDFYFAYDATSQKYGYKAGSDGDFVPFSSGGSGGIGWVTPPETTHEGMTFGRCDYVSGGYSVDDDIVYIDIIVQATYTGNGAYIKGSPKPATIGGSYPLLMLKSGATLSTVSDDNYLNSTTNCMVQDDLGYINLPTVSAVGTYYRVFGEYPKYTS